MRRSTQIIVLAIGVMVGITVASFVPTAGLLPIILPIPLLLVIGYLSRRNQVILVTIFLLGLSLGMGRQWVYHQTRPSSTIDNLQNKKTAVEGIVVGEPYYDQWRNYVFYLSDLSIGGQHVVGQLRVKSLVGNAKEGYRVVVVGKVRPSLGKATSQISYAQSSVTSTQVAPLVAIKTEFSKGVRRALPEPSASFMLGIMIGARSTLPKDIQDLLAIVGLSHLVAVSGYNLTIITLVVQRLTGRKWQWGGLVVSLWLIAGFVVLTGASASIVRAGVMSTLFLLARYYGRNLDTLACVALGVIITLGYSPNYLLTDLSWQLSFLSLAGIVLFAPHIKKLLPGRLPIISEVIAVSLAAQLATFSLVAYVFGSVSIIAPLSNMLILPLVPLLMLCGLLAGVSGIVLPNAAYTLFAPLNFVVLLLLDLLRYLSSLPLAAVKNQQPTATFVVGFYAILTVLAFVLRRPHLLASTKLELKNATILGVANKELV